MLSLKLTVPLANLFFINISKDNMKCFIESTFLLYQFNTETLSEDKALGVILYVMSALCLSLK